MKLAEEMHRVSLSTRALQIIASFLETVSADSLDAMNALIVIKKRLIVAEAGLVKPSYITKEKLSIEDKLGIADDPIVAISSLMSNTSEARKTKRKLLWDKVSSGKQCTQEEYMEGMTYGMESGLLTPEQLEKFSNELMGVIEIGAEKLTEGNES